MQAGPILVFRLLHPRKWYIDLRILRFVIPCVYNATSVPFECHVSYDHIAFDVGSGGFIEWSQRQIMACVCFRS